MSQPAIMFLVVLACLCWQNPGTAQSLSDLKKDQAISGLRVANLYADADSRIIGAKLWHRTGAPIYLLQIETVPQAFMWVDTPTTSNAGLPHSLEHLLSGKGTKGRYLNLLTEMRFSQLGAATFRDYNFYSFSSGTGLEGFFEQFHAWLDALYKPDFTDLEAEREFYHLGVQADAATKRMALVEKGTVYDEMQSGQGVNSYDFELKKSALADTNPFAFNGGGVPDEMRHVTASDIRKFHTEHYHLGPTTGFIFALDPKENPIAFLERIAAELGGVSDPRHNEAGAPAGTEPKYPILPANDKEIKICPFPSNKETDLSAVRLAWRPARAKTQTQVKLLQLLFKALAEGDKSLVYKAAIDTKERRLDSGATRVGASIFLGNSPFFPAEFVSFSGIPGNRITTELVGQLREHVAATIGEISKYPDDSPSLHTFNKLVLTYAKAWRRSQRVWIKRAPQFGLNYETEWKEYLEYLEMDPAFVRSISENGVWEEAESQIKSGRNIWRELIRDFSLLEVPYATASLPSPQLLQEMEAKRNDRIAQKIAELMQQFSAKDQQEALNLFAEQEAAKTLEIDKIAARVPHPRLGDHPPLTQDDDIRYSQFHVRNVPVIASLFDRAPTIDVGLSFDLRQIPTRYYRYLPILPRCLDSLGLKTPGGIISYTDLLALTQTDINDFAIQYELNPSSRRADLTIRASVSDLGELRRGLALIQQMIDFNNLAPTNADRLRDLVDRRIRSDDASYSGDRDYPYMNLGYAFREQNDPLYAGLVSVFARAYWDSRLQWLLHKPVSPEELTELSKFAESVLPYLSGRSGKEISEWIKRSPTRGLQRELLEYLDRSVPAFSEAELNDGLRRLTMEVQEDLQTGPDRTIADLRELLQILLTQDNLHVDLALDPSDLEGAKANLKEFVSLLPRHLFVHQKPPHSAPQRAFMIEKLRKRYPRHVSDFPLFVAIEDPRSTTASMVFFGNYPGYSQLDAASLSQILSANLVSGAGPHTFFTRTIQDGLAYSDGLVCNPDQQLIRYFAENSPDVVALIQLVNSTAVTISGLRDSALVDYSLRGALPSPRSMATTSERAIGLAHDIRDGKDPSKVRQFSTALLSMRKDPDLLDKITSGLLSSLAPVLMESQFMQQQERAKSIFFFVGSERLLAEAEKRLSIPKLLRLYPSDYWIDY